MTAFDYGVLAILACSMLLGAWRGLASELLALAAWVVALLAASEVPVAKDATETHVQAFVRAFASVRTSGTIASNCWGPVTPSIGPSA